MHFYSSASTLLLMFGKKRRRCVLCVCIVLYVSKCSLYVSGHQIYSCIKRVRLLEVLGIVEYYEEESSIYSECVCAIAVNGSKMKKKIHDSCLYIDRFRT